jgi:hypothetical protein
MFIAIFLGLLLGGGAAVLFAQIPGNLFNASEKENQLSANEAITPVASPTPLTQQDIGIEILFPSQQEFVESDEINVSGKTKPGATVAITSAIDETVAVADNAGTFSSPIELIEGANELLVVSIDGTEEAERIIVVNYTPEEL